MSRKITADTAFDHIRGLIARNDFATAETLMEKYSLTDRERRELNRLLKDRRREASFSRSRREPPRLLRLAGEWLWLPVLLVGYVCLFPVVEDAVRRLSRSPLQFLRLLPLFALCYLPLLVLLTDRYVKALFLWTTGTLRSEPAEVMEVRSETAFSHSRYRPDVKHPYTISLADLRPLEPAPWSLRTIRFYDGGIHNPPWPEQPPPFLHPGDRVTLYYDRRGIRVSLTRYTRKSLTLDWLKALGQWTGILGLALLAISLLSALAVRLPQKFF